jgi:hypothetical protein
VFEAKFAKKQGEGRFRFVLRIQTKYPQKTKDDQLVKLFIEGTAVCSVVRIKILSYEKGTVFFDNYGFYYDHIRGSETHTYRRKL